jgi:hypothetical protein
MELETSMLALYIDLENMPKDLDIDSLMQTLTMEDPYGYACVFAVKAAFGAAEHVPKELKERLRDNSFHIVDTPHIAQKKNRADLMISIDAFEKLYLNNPAITRFIFVTSDSDFSVIMDRLRAYGKQVWLVCRKSDEAKAILAKSCDNMLLIDDFVKTKKTAEQKLENDEQARELFLEALGFIDLNRLPVKLSVLGSKMKQIDPSFEIKATSFKKVGALVDEFKEKGIVTVSSDENELPQVEDINLPED